MKIFKPLIESKSFQKAAASYAALESRDRLALGGLGIFFSLLFITLGIWQPVMDYAEKAAANRQIQQELLTWMKATEGQARSSAGSQASHKQSGQSLLTSVSRTAKTFNIKPNKLQPESSDEVSVWFEGVAFNLLFEWLQDIQLKQGIYVRQISVDRSETSGAVNARIVLRSA